MVYHAYVFYGSHDMFEECNETGTSSHDTLEEDSENDTLLYQLWWYAC